jgi:hypothetical protein
MPNGASSRHHISHPGRSLQNFIFKYISVHIFGFWIGLFSVSFGFLVFFWFMQSFEEKLVNCFVTRQK